MTAATGLERVSEGRPVRRIRHPLMLAAALAISAVVLTPIAALTVIALSGSGEDWPHLAANVLPTAAVTTAALIAMVSAGTALIGVTAAWLIVAFDFPLRRLASWALVLPLAVPPYLAAYAFGEFFLFTGPVQSALRAIFGFHTPQDYWFPDLRTTPGAAFVLTSVLYPYVYLTSRFVFLMQGRNIGDVARTLGAGPARVFFRVLLPVARPAIAAGVVLVLMETINDIGVAEYLGVRTLTSAIYTTWINRSSLEGAAQLAMLMLLVVLALLACEQFARRLQRFHNARATQLKARPPRTKLKGFKGLTALAAVAAPVLLGFGVPLWVFGRYASRRLDYLINADLGKAFLNSVLTASVTALLTVSLALFLLYAVRVSRSAPMRSVVRVASVGYALPGTILGLGLLFSLAQFDNRIDAIAREYLGFSTGLLLTGSAAAVVLACTIRFLALAEGAVRSGIEKLPSNLDDAARSLGKSPLGSAVSILAPLLKPAILTALVLVFVDTVKELSATILLRPFGFNTLATLVYENASRAVVEDGAIAALLIIATATVPVVLLSRALARDQDAFL
ncbi:iron ABC transporter permease [Mesorhizobium sp. LHD-90]|uniref:ABC transporter permease n=1 Tax=Mesorhizobium sp. LHD-90 TaxID=3071414 RepID=UPI0027E0F506|nr:iron ABC transporter permease [Mesorhizobium sp. LHD-90]MDQ6435159.1 iron ABC transporter permease [Mesorhizobium sp. LHD-90]